jgi:hypothetical protein
VLALVTSELGLSDKENNMNSQPVKIDVILVRALKTFIQAFLAAILAGLTGAVSVATTKALIIGALSAAVSAVMNLFLQPQEAK